MVNENSEIGFLYDQQSTKLDIGGTATVTLGDMSVHNYHGYYAYNAMDTGAKARPYFLFGLGATQFGALTATGRSVHRRDHEVLRDGRPRTQALPEPQVRPPARGPLDPDLHQVRRHRVVV